MVHFVESVLCLESSVGEILIQIVQVSTNTFFFFYIYIIIFNDTLVSSTHTLPVNIFNLEGGETMLAGENENVRAPGL